MHTDESIARFKTSFFSGAQAREETGGEEDRREG